MDEEFLRDQAESALSVSQALPAIPQLDQWVFQFAKQFVKGKILELGSGAGNIAALCSSNGISLRVSDPDGHQCASLQRRFEGDEMIKNIHRIDLLHKTFPTKYDSFLERFDTVISPNPDKFNFSDASTWTAAKNFLRSRGRLILLQHTSVALFEDTTEGLEAWNRWSRRHLSKLLGKDGELIKIQPFILSEISNAPNTGAKDALPFLQASDESSFHQPGLYVAVVARKL